MKDECHDLFIPLFCIDEIPEMKLIGYTDVFVKSENQSDAGLITYD